MNYGYKDTYGNQRYTFNKEKAANYSNNVQKNVAYLVALTIILLILSTLYLYSISGNTQEYNPYYRY